MGDACCHEASLYPREPRFIKFPEGHPPIRFIGPEKAPPHKVPAARGEASEALVPDTCDVEEAARLFLENYLTEITVLNPEYLHEPFSRTYNSAIPPRLTLDFGIYLCALQKYRESMPLLRLMTGSRKGLEIDAAWTDLLLRSIGPDGLNYNTRAGRPWDGYIGHGIKDSGYWFPMPAGVDFYASLPTGNGRMLGAIASYYELTGDEIWNRTGRGIVDEMNRRVIKVGAVAFFPKFIWLPDETLTPAQIEQATQEWKDPTIGETDHNAPLWHTFIITGLCKFYRVSGHQPALELARGLANHIKETKYLEEWKSHFHCMTLAVHAIIEVAQSAGDRELADYARKFYEYAKSGKDSIALPQIGYFFNGQGADNGAEGCSIADMTVIAVKLARLGLGDQYWEDADRYIRNCLTGIQRPHPGVAGVVFQKLIESGEAKEVPLSYSEMADHVSERMMGSFSSHYSPNDIYYSPYFDSCCQGNISRALYYVWENILRFEDETLSLNLLLNRTSAWADVQSFIPYIGRVAIKIKAPCRAVKVRMNDWIEKDKVLCEVDGKKASFGWEGSYVTLGAAKAGQTVTLSFPIHERTEKLDSFGHTHEAIFKGNDCVDITPKGKYWTLFQRDHYRGNNPRYVKLRRFVCENPIEY